MSPRELGYFAEELRRMTISDIDPNVSAELWGPDGEMARLHRTVGCAAL